MYNKIILIGNLGRDPEIRSLPSGTPVCEFSLATNHRWRDRDGNQQEKTEWFRVSVFGRQAEVAGRYMSRGRQVYVEGRLETRTYEDRSGEKRFSLDVRCDNFQLLGQRGDAEPSSRDDDSSLPSSPSDTAEDDDIPF